MAKNTRNYSSLIDEIIRDDSINFLEKFQKIKNHVLRWETKKKEIENKIMPLNRDLQKYIDAIKKGEEYMSKINSIVEQNIGAQIIQSTDEQPPKYRDATKNEPSGRNA